MPDVLEQSGPLAPSSKPWTLIRDAIHDLKLQEKTPGVVIDMHTWHTPLRDGEHCLQCLAGCVMSRRLRVPLYRLSAPSRIEKGVRNRLLALDCFRTGRVWDGLNWLRLPYPATIPRFVPIITYDIDADRFKSDMLGLAHLLEREFTK